MLSKYGSFMLGCKWGGNEQSLGFQSNTLANGRVFESDFKIGIVTPLTF